MLKLIQSVMAFVHERALLGREDLSQIMGQVVFEDAPSPSSSPSTSVLPTTHLHHRPTILSALSTLVHSRCIPTSPHATDAYLRYVSTTLGSSTLEFEHDLLACSYLLPTDAPTLLSHYATQTVRTYADARRSTVLALGRDVATGKGSDRDYHDTTRVGIDVYAKRKAVGKGYVEGVDKGCGEVEDMAVFVLHRCAVSNVALELMELCKATMEEAVVSAKAAVAVGVVPPPPPPPPPTNPSSSMPPPPPLPPTNDPTPKQKHTRLARLLPPTLYRTARELLNLFRAVIPATHKLEIATFEGDALVDHGAGYFCQDRVLAHSGASHKVVDGGSVHGVLEAASASGITPRPCVSLYRVCFVLCRQSLIGDMGVDTFDYIYPFSLADIMSDR